MTKESVAPPAESTQASGLLFRSRIEITRILQRLARDRAVVSAQIGADRLLFLSRLLHVDPAGEFLVLAYSEERNANAALLEQPSLALQASEQRGRIEFAAAAPLETVYKGGPAVRCAFPKVLVRSQHRAHPRFRLPADASLRCIADSGGITPFEARIVDISRGGMGGMIYGPGVRLAPDTVLKGCKIMIPGSKAIIADLEVRYTVAKVQPDGSLALRSGVRFLDKPKGMNALLTRFVIAFGQDGRKL